MPCTSRPDLRVALFVRAGGLFGGGHAAVPGRAAELPTSIVVPVSNPRLRWLYRIEDGIQLMLANQAVAVPDEEHERLIRHARRGEVTAITVGQADILAAG